MTVAISVTNIKSCTVQNKLSIYLFEFSDMLKIQHSDIRNNTTILPFLSELTQQFNFAKGIL
jgi:hypothetical protein